MENQSKTSIGVIVARFQVAALHQGHEWLIREVGRKHSHVLILLGTSIVKGSIRNPLNYEDRKAMIEFSGVCLDCMTAYGTKFEFNSLPDHSSDETWSKNLDEIVDFFVNETIFQGALVDRVAPYQQAILYGARDSFIPYYKGSYQTHILEVPENLKDTGIYSGTATRKKLIANPPHNEDYRAGKIVAASELYPINYMCVDAVIFFPGEGEEKAKVLLGRKPGEAKFRFIGGFTDPTDASLEAAAVREAGEEVVIRHPVYRGAFTDPITIEQSYYLASVRIDDPRYRNERDKIMSAVIICKTFDLEGLEGADDIEEVKWFTLKELRELDIMEPHKAIVELLKDRWEPMKDSILYDK